MEFLLVSWCTRGGIDTLLILLTDVCPTNKYMHVDCKAKNNYVFTCLQKIPDMCLSKGNHPNSITRNILSKCLIILI